VNPTLLTEYDASVFHDLHEFHIARAILKQLGQAVTSLGDFVCRYGLQDAVAANLLHKHFDITDDERVVREFVGRTAYMKPRSASEAQQTDTAILPYLWQYADGKYGFHFYPLEFATYYGAEIAYAKAEIERVQQASDFLGEFASQLWKLGLEDVFGIALLASRRGITLVDGEAMLETTDVRNRVLTLEPVDETTLGEYDTTETLWTFSPPTTKEDTLHISA
jgi:hypothetical protein